MSDLPRLLDENPRMREDFISTLGSFFERHSIEVRPDDLEGAEDVIGYLFPAGLAQTSLRGSPAIEASMSPADVQTNAERMTPSQDGGRDDDNP